jgi:hypothetical protein
MPQVYFWAVKAPCLMAGATAVTAVTGDFTGSFTSLASSFPDNFIITSPRPLSLVGRRWGQSTEVPMEFPSLSGGTAVRASQAQAEGQCGASAGSRVRDIFPQATVTQSQ